MNGNELRIGNCVLEKGRLVVIHDGFGIDHAHNFEPIPLTEDWLVKMGFRRKVFPFDTYNMQSLFTGRHEGVWRYGYAPPYA